MKKKVAEKPLAKKRGGVSLITDLVVGAVETMHKHGRKKWVIAIPASLDKLTIDLGQALTRGKTKKGPMHVRYNPDSDMGKAARAAKKGDKSGQ